MSTEYENTRIGKGRRNTDDGPCDADHPDHCEFADAAAQRAVKKTFAILGVNIDEPKEVKEFQENLLFGEKLRKASDKGMFAFITTLVALMAAAVWAALHTR